MEQELKYSQSIHELKQYYPKTNNDNPYPVPGLIFIIDGPKNALIVQLITPLYRDSEHTTTEIDLIHFLVNNVPEKTLTQLYKPEILHILTESTQLAIDATNKILKRNYPKAKQIPPYTHKSINDTWDATVKSKPIKLDD